MVLQVLHIIIFVLSFYLWKDLFVCPMNEFTLAAISVTLSENLRSGFTILLNFFSNISPLILCSKFRLPFPKCINFAFTFIQFQFSDVMLIFCISKSLCNYSLSFSRFIFLYTVFSHRLRIIL